MGVGFLEKNIFIGDSAATSHMTNRKLGVYDLVPINGSVMIGNGKSISCTHKGKMDVICKHKDGSLARETWEVKIVPELNHDLFSFTKAMKDRWQMNGRWKDNISEQRREMAKYHVETIQEEKYLCKKSSGALPR